jgi:hypothetical protein
VAGAEALGAIFERQYGRAYFDSVDRREKTAAVLGGGLLSRRPDTTHLVGEHWESVVTQSAPGILTNWARAGARDGTDVGGPGPARLGGHLPRPAGLIVCFMAGR